MNIIGNITHEELRYIILYDCIIYNSNLSDKIYEEIGNKYGLNVDEIGDFLDNIASKINDLDILYVTKFISLAKDILKESEVESYITYTALFRWLLSFDILGKKIMGDVKIRKVFINELLDILEYYKPIYRYRAGFIIDNLTNNLKVGGYEKLVGNDNYKYWEILDIDKAIEFYNKNI